MIRKGDWGPVRLNDAACDLLDLPHGTCGYYDDDADDDDGQLACVYLDEPGTPHVGALLFDGKMAFIRRDSLTAVDEVSISGEVFKR